MSLLVLWSLIPHVPCTVPNSVYIRVTTDCRQVTSYVSNILFVYRCIVLDTIPDLCPVVFFLEEKEFLKCLTPLKVSIHVMSDHSSMYHYSRNYLYLHVMTTFCFFFSVVWKHQIPPEWSPPTLYYQLNFEWSHLLLLRRSDSFLYLLQTLYDLYFYTLFTPYCHHNISTLTSWFPVLRRKLGLNTRSRSKLSKNRYSFIYDSIITRLNVVKVLIIIV